MGDEEGQADCAQVSVEQQRLTRPQPQRQGAHLRTYDTHALKEAIDAIVHKNLCSSNVLLVVAYPRM